MSWSLVSIFLYFSGKSCFSLYILTKAKIAKISVNLTQPFPTTTQEPLLPWLRVKNRDNFIMRIKGCEVGEGVNTVVTLGQRGRHKPAM